jgi:hypothetical protein
MTETTCILLLSAFMTGACYGALFMAVAAMGESS